MAEDSVKRFTGKVKKTATCWNWIACRDGDGYGRFRYNGRTIGAHRAAYLIFVGDIKPASLTVDHRCRNRGCVNPEHLRLLTREGNVLAGEGFSARNKFKTTCLQGHPFDSVRIRSDGKRQFRTCRVCERKKRRESYSRNKTATNERRRLKYKTLKGKTVI